ncbi:MAG: hypothetical protein U1C33_04045, partial [Candidatus Cloacimonadaceae bacterium]|nr:hypothetical protein [Candidatus Cloacimonadaceae bacterium]
MYRKSWFWILFLIVVALSIFFVYKYAHQALSVINVETTMSRQSSLLAADSLHKELGIQLSGYRQAVGFFSESEFQNYVELKAGGKPAFEKIIKGKDFKPYYWYIRHFVPGETREAVLRFTPTGQVLSFTEKVPENEDIPSLTREEAQYLADSLAVNKWQVPLHRYTLIESATDHKPNGRVDHTFTYERSDFKLGEALFRLKLVVSGNRLSSLEPNVK